MQKKQLIIAGVVVLALAVVANGTYFIFGGSKDESTPVASDEPVKVKKRLSPPQNLLPISDRPLVSLRPFGQAGGRFVSIEVEQVRVSAPTAEYEIVYDVADVSAVSASGAKVTVPASEREGGQQAFQGELDLASLPTKTESRFGTCSAGGACINHQVKQGLVVLNFGASEPYGVTSEWFYFEAVDKDESVAAGETGFSLTSSVFANARDFLIMRALGVPDGVPGAVATIPDPESREGGVKPQAWQLHFSSSITAGEAEATIDGLNDGQQLAVHDGTSWSVSDDLTAVPVGDRFVYAIISAQE